MNFGMLLAINITIITVYNGVPMTLQLKFGKSTRELQLPDHCQVDILAPRSVPPLQAPAKALAEALRSPFGGDPLADMPRPQRVAIALPDETRPFPVQQLLPVLLRHLLQRWPELTPEAVTVYVGGGLHPPMDEDGLARVVPLAARQGLQVLPHDAKNDPMLEVGHTSRGTPVRINKGFAEADLRIVMGQIDPHQFVGFTGGSKGACIGLAAAETIRSNHALMFQEGAVVGRLQGNPVREDLNEAGDLLGLQLVVNVINDPQKKPVWLGAGTPKEVLNAGAEVCEQVYGVQLETLYDLVIASCGGYPKDICLYQAQKGLNMASMAARPGGKVLLLAACEQGVGDEDYYDYVCRFDSMQATVDDFQRCEFRMGAHKAWLFGKSALRCEVVLDSLLPQEIVKSCHLTPGDAQQTLTRWLSELPAGARIAVAPNANTTFFHLGPALSD